MVRERHRNKINTAGTFWLSKKSLVGDVDLVLCGFYFEVYLEIDAVSMLILYKGY